MKKNTKQHITPENPRRNRLRNLPEEKKTSLPERAGELSELLAEHFGKWTLQSKEKIISSDNVIFIVSLNNFDNGYGDNRVVIRFPVQDAETRPATHHPHNQAWVTSQWRKEGAKVPKVLCVDPKGNFLVETFLTGSNLRTFPSEEHYPVMSELGEQLNLMHRVKMKGYGTLISDNGEMKGSFEDWKSYFDYLFMGRLASLVETKVWASIPLMVENINALYERYLGYLTNFNRPVLLHGDLNSDNVRVKRSDPTDETSDLTLLGILDFCDCISGDPLFEFGALLETSNDWKCIEIIDETYGRSLLEQSDVIVFYAIFISIFYMNEDKLRLDRIYLYTKKIIEFFSFLSITIEA
eukprot:CAMPEP_0174260922 /NCGR_PEP_ID=MMETSP0439-20130205/11014_1 /TAXON_ID=0 /ORGANISM="Stereomyxa ramosa, Strain Chinc5" /LENGTH=352 /DNA_ID=CAMNT_0015345305 /DNA_START=50 /DNA_END=1108 /DNA_ORIENTATION=-